MIDGGRIQWLLGLGILVVGAFMLFGQADEAPSQDQAPFSIAPEDIPPPPAGLPIKLVDSKTKSCMADMACMQEFFLKITLGNEYEPRQESNPRINKWRMSLNYRVYGQDQIDQDRLDAFYQSLADMTKIASTVGLGLGPDRRGINVIVLLTADLKADLKGRFSELADEAFRPVPGFLESFLRLDKPLVPCAGLVVPTSGGAAVYAAIHIDSTLRQAADYGRCVLEEFSQMLGLYADVADDIDSLYTDQEHRRQLTEFDFLLLRLLYHPLIEPGMNRDEVIAVFPDVYQEIITEPVAVPTGIQFHKLENK